ncbi:MAG: ArnT family glycosyltransferase [Armatimonadota bacterium]
MDKKTKLQQNPRAIALWALLACGLFCLYFANMGAYPLVDPDEPVYGQIAKEMAAGAGWLTPHYAGRPWFDKPPLFYWLSGASVSALGPTELACRLPSALLAVGLVLLVYALASYELGRRAGLISALVMATCLQQFVLARAAVTDITFVFCLTASLYAYRRWLDAQGRAVLGWALLCGVMTGLAMLAKGPVAPILLGVTFLIHLKWTGRLRRLLSVDALVTVVAALMVGIPWYVAMYVIHKDAFVEGFLVANNISRFLNPEHKAQTGGWYSYFMNIPVLFIFFFPWSVFLPQSIARSWRSNETSRLASVWFAVVFVFFSISKTQLVTYIFPLYPAAALFVGMFWTKFASKDGGLSRGTRVGLWLNLAIGMLLAIAGVASVRLRFPEAMIAVVIMGGILVSATALALGFGLRRGRSFDTIPWILGTGMAVFALWLMVGVMPFVASRTSARDLVRGLPELYHSRVILYSAEKPSILFYSGILPEIEYSQFKVKRLLLSGDAVVVICKTKDQGNIAVPGASEIRQVGELIALANPSALQPKGSEKQ